MTKGVRLQTHAVYLKPDAHHIKTGYFDSFNYNKDIADIDFNGEEFKNLTEEQQRILTV